MLVTIDFFVAGSTDLIVVFSVHNIIRCYVVAIAERKLALFSITNVVAILINVTKGASAFKDVLVVRIEVSAFTNLVECCSACASCGSAKVCIVCKDGFKGVFTILFILFATNATFLVVLAVAVRCPCGGIIMSKGFNHFTTRNVAFTIFTECSRSMSVFCAGCIDLFSLFCVAMCACILVNNFNSCDLDVAVGYV